MRVKFIAIMTIVGSAVSRLFGGFSFELKTLVLFMLTDFLTGLCVGGIFKKSLKTKNGALESNAGFKGISKKCITLLFVMVGHRLDVMLGVNFVRSGVIFAYTANELISIIENAGLMGIPIPKALKKAISILKDDSEN